MKSFRYTLLGFIAVSCLFSIIACNNKKPVQDKDDSGRSHFEKLLTAEDTSTVKALIDTFFVRAISGDFYGAAGMIYRNDKDVRVEPELLDNSEIAEVVNMLETFPVKDYEIVDMKFDTYYSNQVLCNMIIREEQDGVPAFKTKISFKPINYLGGWVLCLTNSTYGDEANLVN